MLECFAEVTQTLITYLNGCFTNITLTADYQFSSSLDAELANILADCHLRSRGERTTEIERTASHFGGKCMEIKGFINMLLEVCLSLIHI